LENVKPSIVLLSTYSWFNTMDRWTSYTGGRLLFLFRIHSSGVRREFLPKNEQELVFSKSGCSSSVCSIYLCYKKTSFRFPCGLWGSEALQKYVSCWKWSVWWWYTDQFRSRIWMTKLTSQRVQTKSVAELLLQLYGFPDWKRLVPGAGGIHLNPFR